MVGFKGLAGLAIVLAAVAMAVLAAGAFGASRWAAATRALNARLDAARQPAGPLRYDAARELAGLPEPVQRFFRSVLTDGQPMIAAVEIEHEGTFNLAAEGADRWRPFTSRQRSTMRRPGFVWDGRVALAPGIAVHVHDAYVGGEGLLHPALLGLIPLGDLRGSSPEPDGVAHGEFLRWFAEAAWYPTALLPSQGVVWSEVDADAARASVGDGALRATLLFRFDRRTGAIASVRADARGATVGGRVVLLPWEGRWFDVVERDGMRVPQRGEVAWVTASGPRAYWRGRVTTLRFEAAR